jgi:hypothetical protein
MPFEIDDDGSLIVTLPEHCAVCGKLVGKSEIAAGKVVGSIFGVRPVLVHRFCAEERWG